MKKIFPIILLFFFAHSTVGQELTKEFDALMSETFKDDGPGAVALVIKDEKVLYRKAFGMANLELGVKMKPENIFRIGSITKQFTASAILKLRDEGKLSLDDAITKYIKDYPTHGHEITIKHLLTHTSGIKSYTALAEWDAEVKKREHTPKEVIDVFKHQPMDFDPGEQWKYSDSGYFLLGYIIEIVSGKTYEKYIDTEFFRPLGMVSSSYGSTSRIIPNRASGYGRDENGYINAPFLNMTNPYAAGALLSNVDDLYKWYSAVMEDKVISKASREEAHSTYKLKNGKTTGYGYGWLIGNIQGSLTISHPGGINGFLTSSMYLPEEKLFVAVFSNCTCNPPRNILNKVAALAIGKPFTSIKKIELDDAITDKYLGKYELTPNFVISIFKEKSKIYTRATGQSKIEIIPFEKNKFSLVNVDVKLTFNVDENGKVSSLTLHQDGDYEAKKIE
jgi:CubicO group peptidase (beta-lactamase class C family)